MLHGRRCLLLSAAAWAQRPPRRAPQARRSSRRGARRLEGVPTQLPTSLPTSEPWRMPTSYGHEEGSACDSIHLEAGWGEVCDSAHGETHGCPIVNTLAWDSEFWNCNDLCGGTGGWCNHASYMSDNHCGSDVHEEYELSCDQGIRDSGLESPSHVLCWCEVFHDDHEDEDEDDCTPGWNTMQCLDETLMYGNG